MAVAVRSWVDRARGSASGQLAAASVVARAAVLVVLVASAQVLDSPDFDAVAYLLAVSSAAQILLDPGIAMYLVHDWHTLEPADQVARWKAGIRLQTLAGLGVFAVTTGFGLVVSASGGIAVAASLGALAGVEGLLRYARAPWQAEHEFLKYAAVDILVAAGRLVTVGGLVATATLTGFASINAVVALLLVAVATPLTVGYARRSTARIRVSSLVRNVWPYAASTSCSSVYAQVPAVLLGAIGSVREAAIYSVATRITQPTELVPASIANAYLPRLAKAGGTARQHLFQGQLRRALTVAGLIAVAIVATSPWVLKLFGLDWSQAGVVLAILAAALLPKFANYQLVALAIAQGRIHRRLVSSVIVAIVSVVAVCVVAAEGADAVAVVSLACELLLCGLLLRANRRDPDLRARP